MELSKNAMQEKKEKSLLLRKIDGTKPFMALVSFLTFLFTAGALFGLAMGLDVSANVLIASIMIVVVLFISLFPLFIISYLIGYFSKRKNVSASNYVIWSEIGALLCYLLLRDPLFSGNIIDELVIIIIAGTMFAIVTHFGVHWGRNKREKKELYENSKK